MAPGPKTTDTALGIAAIGLTIAPRIAPQPQSAPATCDATGSGRRLAPADTRVRHVELGKLRLDAEAPTASSMASPAASAAIRSTSSASTGSARTRGAALALCLAATAPLALARPASPSSPPAARPATFVSVTEAELRAALPAWPADDSLAGRTDLAVVLAAQATRSAREADEASADAQRGPVGWAERVLNDTPGSRFDRDRHPRTAWLLDALHEDLRPIALAAQAVHPLRLRPAFRGAGVDPSLASERLPATRAISSYPSERGMATRVWAHALGALVPAAAERADAAARTSGWQRVVGGAHYPSDLDGARQVASLVTAKLDASQAFAAALAEARRELASTPPRAASRSGNAGHYLRIDDLPPARLLEPPPVDGSLADAVDRDAVRAAQRDRDAGSSATARVIEARDILEVLRGLAPAAGIDARALESPEIASLLERVRDDLEPYILAARREHARPRPPRADPSITVLGELPATPTYPSAKVWSVGAQLHVLAALVPTLDTHIEPALDEIGRARVLAGIHYPSDIAGAKRAARRFADALVATPRFAAEREGLAAALARVR